MQESEVQLQLQVGKSYVTRDGQVRGPMEKNPSTGSWGESFPFRCYLEGDGWCEECAYTAEGRFHKEKDAVHHLDLIREYVKPSMEECFGDIDD